MSFLYYNKNNGLISNTGDKFSLAGYNLIYNLWKKKKKPTATGWHLNADDLIKEHSGGKESGSSGALIIDFDPKSRWRIGLIELHDIYIYTYSGAKKDASSWSPMMLRFKDVLYKEFETELKEEQKINIMKEIQIDDNADEFIEFLYLNGTDRGWNWGRNGMTNAAFLQNSARDYFRKYF